MAVTVKISDDANALLEAYLGWKRLQDAGKSAERINKEDVASESVKWFVVENMPNALLKQLMRTDQKGA